MERVSCGRLGPTCHLATRWNLEGRTGLGQDLGMGGKGATGVPRGLEGEEAGLVPGKVLGRRSSWRNQALGPPLSSPSSPHTGAFLCDS